MVATAAAVVLNYVLGSVPTAYIVVRAAGRGDIRRLGSGNVGASNVGRVLGWRGFALVFAADAAKGAAAVAAAQALAVPIHPGWAALAAAVGHCYPLWLRGQGGKAVATGVGGLALLMWPAAAAGMAAYALLTAATRTSSIGSLGGLVAATIAVLRWGDDGLRLPFLLLAALILWRHRDNLKRLRAGTETGIGHERSGDPGTS